MGTILTPMEKLRVDARRCQSPFTSNWEETNRWTVAVARFGQDYAEFETHGDGSIRSRCSSKTMTRIGPVRHT